MSEEEKKAIEELKQELESTIRANNCGLSNNDFKREINTYTTVLKLVENQQKEIEELKQQNINLVQEKMINKNSTQPLSNFYDYYDVIPKSKIKEKIKEYDGLQIIDKTAWEEQVKPLIELLEEDK